ncbi:MAG TPA: ABC transporter substrate-binding protein [Beijerinckiaceae bacterium]|jgi:iron(III) transport system substrate-binding protein|nr:ABC transporter substrate-binding protein [Beijerinckiaceae bacterium]
MNKHCECRSALMRVLLGGAALLIGSSFAWSAPRSVAEIATYQGPDRQALLEEGAKQEGALEVYTTGTQADPVFQAFEAKYPYIRVDAFKADSPAVARRILEEYKAGKYVADEIDLSIGGLGAMLKAGILQNFWSPELANIEADAIEPGKHWVVCYQSYIGLGYNTKEVSEAEVPKSFDDLLDPKWKGKMALPNGATVIEWVGVLEREKGDDFVRKLGQQNFHVYAVTARAVANLIVSGEVPLSPAMYNSHFANSRAQGASVAWRAIGAVESFVGAEALAAKAPHPSAAMLFIDFAMSMEGAKVFQKLGYATTRTDLENADKPPKVYHLTAEPDYQRNYDKWAAITNQVFGSQ